MRRDVLVVGNDGATNHDMSDLETTRATSSSDKIKSTNTLRNASLTLEEHEKTILI